MAVTRQIRFSDGDVCVLIGTMKGLFLMRSGGRRGAWELGGPHFPGHSVYAVGFDGRQGRNKMFAANHSFHWGAVLQSSDDFGRTWTAP